MSPRRLALVSTFAALGVLALTATSASAKEFHTFSTTFGKAGSGNGELALAEHSGVAVNAETGDVYVADTGNARVQEFSSTGIFIRAFATADPTFIAIDNFTGASKGDVYVADSATGTVSKFEPDGTPVSTWGTGGQLSGSGELDGIAVNPSGQLFVLRGAEMSVFDPGGTPASSFNLQYPAAPIGIAVSSGGEIYTRYTSGNETLRFNSSGSFLGEFFPSPTQVTTGFTIDPSEGDLYIDQPTEVAAYGPSRELLQTFGSPEIGQGAGVAVGPTHTVFVADASNQRIDVFSAGPGIPLAVTVSGPGSVSATEGTISACTEAGGPRCEAEYPKGKTITLTASPTERSTFAGWGASECKSIPNPTECEVEMTAAKSVEAKFEAIHQQALTVANPGTGPGGGIITGTSPGGEFQAIECGNGASVCTETYNEGAGPIILIAAPTERSTTPIVWHGCDATPSETECEVTMTAAKSVEAKFTPITQEALTVTPEGTGVGTVSGTSPGGEFTPIDCGNGASVCSEQYNEGAEIVLTATPATHSKFTGWEDCPNVLSSNEYTVSECEVQMTKAQTVKSEFTAIPQANLEVEIAGAGAGTVTSFPPGISCASGTCTEHFDTEGPESTITLTEIPEADNSFHAWAGCTSEPTPNTCEVEMTAAKTIKAEFVPTLHTLTVTPTGPGSVSAASGAIAGCETGGHGTCSGSYQEGSAVTLTASPQAHEHVAWTGCTRESANTCEVEMSFEVKAVKAAFLPNLQTLTVTPVGAGSVTASVAPISHCSTVGGTCAGGYAEAGTATLAAFPVAHHSVIWTGCTAVPSPDTCEVAIGATATAVKAEFSANNKTLTVTPTGAGSVRANSGAISHCSTAGGTCAGEYIEAATVTLTAMPDPHQIVAWEGCTVVPRPDACEVEIGASSATVKASFAQATDTLTLIKAGTGQGTIACDGGPCASVYPEGTVLTLAASSASGSTFAGWSGAGCSGSGACQVTLQADTTLTATFNSNPPPPEVHCVVPSLAGETQAQARSALSAAHCSLGTVTKPKPKKHHKLGPLVVKSSSPEAGTTLAADSKVNLKLDPKARKGKK